MSQVITILVVQSDRSDIERTISSLNTSNQTTFQISIAHDFMDAAQIVKESDFDIALVDISKSGSSAIELIVQARDILSEMPIIVLNDVDDTKFGVDCLHLGVQDYLVKDKDAHLLLEQHILFSIKRFEILPQLHALSFTDELTGLFNRRGFYSLAKHHLLLSQRNSSHMLCIMADVDALKKINDSFGHIEGDNALRDTADTFRKSLRETDLIARLGGDEFSVIALHASPTSGDLLVKRFLQELDKLNSLDKRKYELSISLGTAWYDPKHTFSIDQLLAKADKAMHKNKLGK